MNKLKTLVKYGLTEEQTNLLKRIPSEWLDSWWWRDSNGKEKCPICNTTMESVCEWAQTEDWTYRVENGELMSSECYDTHDFEIEECWAYCSKCDYTIDCAQECVLLDEGQIELEFSELKELTEEQ